jgi:polysaccharide pyruvyl transferase WcaK-like protein
MDMECSRNALEDIMLLLTNKKKAFYLGCLGIENLGDEAMLIAFNKLFGESFFLYTKNYYGKLIRMLKQDRLIFDISILGGGTLINATTDTLDILDKYRAKKKVIFGTGVRDPSFWKSVSGYKSDVPRWVDYLNSSDYIGVRGPNSHNILKQWGVTKEVKEIGDPVLFLSDTKIHTKKQNKILGVNFGTANGNVWGNNEESVLESMISLLKRMQEKGWSFKFFPVCPYDLPNTKRLASSLMQDPKTTIIDNYLDYNHFKQELRYVDVFIGMKLHAVILSVATYTPSIMIEYRPKCRDFMQSVNMGNLVFRCDQLDADILESTINQLYSDLPLVQQVIFSEVQKKILILKTGALAVINLAKT